MAGTMSVEDKLAVTDVIASYARCLDSGDVDGLRHVFSEDAVLDAMNGSFYGLPAIFDWARGLMASGRVGANPPRLVHFVSLPSIRGDGERCSAWTYSTILVLEPDETITIPLVGSYDDQFVKTQGGGWLIQHRRILGHLSRAR